MSLEIFVRLVRFYQLYLTFFSWGNISKDSMACNIFLRTTVDLYVCTLWPVLFAQKSGSTIYKVRERTFSNRYVHIQMLSFALASYIISLFFRVMEFHLPEILFHYNLHSRRLTFLIE